MSRKQMMHKRKLFGALAVLLISIPASSQPRKRQLYSSQIQLKHNNAG